MNDIVNFKEGGFPWGSQAVLKMCFVFSYEVLTASLTSSIGKETLCMLIMADDASVSG